MSAAVPAATVHPAWCSQGPACEKPQVCNDGSTEWAHGAFPFVLRKGPTDARGDVFLVRMDHVTPTDEHLVTAAVVLTAGGSFDAGQARDFAAALLRAADQLDEITAAAPQGQ